MTRGSFIFLVLFSLSHFLESEEIADVRSLESMEDQNRFNSLLLIYRCPKCQSSSLYGSDAPIAKDLKGQIKRLIEEGKNDKEIDNFLRQRYGDYISYKPPFRRNTLILWLSPFFLLFGILFMAIIWNIKKRDEESDLEAENVIKAVERTRLKGILEEES